MEIAQRFFFAGLTPQEKVLRTLKMLKGGLKARKFHYSKKLSRDCSIYLSNDQSTIYWCYGENKAVSSFTIFTKSKFKISSIQ
jgi:hypothetical protein